MSVFTNSASRSKDEAGDYTTAVLGLVGGVPPLEILSMTASRLREATRGLSKSQLARREAPDKWSINHVLRHLADSEIVWGWRMRMALAHDRPPITGYDQDAWAERLDYGKRKLSPALEGFRRTRAENYELLKDLPEAVFARTGQHTKRGTITLLELLRIFAEHAEKHVQQIQSARAAYKEFKAAQAVPSAPA